MSRLSFQDLERIYEALAAGIDRAGSTNEPVFLAKLALLLGERLGEADSFTACVEAALRDLPSREETRPQP
jgi:hypothetical protein